MNTNEQTDPGYSIWFSDFAYCIFHYSDVYWESKIVGRGHIQGYWRRVLVQSILLSIETPAWLFKHCTEHVIASRTLGEDWIWNLCVNPWCHLHTLSGVSKRFDVDLKWANEKMSKRFDVDLTDFSVSSIVGQNIKIYLCFLCVGRRDRIKRERTDINPPYERLQAGWKGEEDGKTEGQ